MMRVALLVLLLSACSQPLRQAVPLERPERPLLPRLTSEDLQCLSTDAYLRLVARDTLRRQYAERLEIIIDSTRESN